LYSISTYQIHHSLTSCIHSFFFVWIGHVCVSLLQFFLPLLLFLNCLYTLVKKKLFVYPFVKKNWLYTRFYHFFVKKKIVCLLDYYLVLKNCIPLLILYHFETPHSITIYTCPQINEVSNQFYHVCNIFYHPWNFK
jgi:hypothetical protein